MPKVGAPDCIDMELAKLPKTTGAPGRKICVRAMPTMPSARVWASTPAGVTGAMAPARMKGATMQAWPVRA